jgi:predicted TIM-barrel fold metal-dependent hydrolase
MPPALALSADSHVVEPADLWTTRIDAAYRDRAPRVVREAPGVPDGDWFVCENLRPFPVAGFAVAGLDPADFGKGIMAGIPGVRPGAFDPVQRLRDQDRDGVGGEVIYPSLAMFLYGIKDAELRHASFRAYNNWLAEFCSHAPQRLAGIALAPMDDVAQAVAELERAAKLGLRGGMIWGAPPASRSYDSPEWDRLWAGAQDLALPLSLHILTGADGTGMEGASLMKTYPSLPHRMERSISDIIFGGALHRFPGLRIVSAENDVGWIPHYLQRLDHSYHNYRSLETGFVIPEKPSFYFRRQVVATFQDDRVGVVMRDFIGADSLMWASDFPHSDSTWPNSRSVIARDFEGVPSADVARITRENCARVYGIG